MNYVTYNEAGHLTGGYEQDLHPAHAGAYIKVSAVERESWTAFQANAERTGLEPAVRAPAAPTVPDVVPMLDARLALIAAGKMAAVQAYLDAIPGIEGEQAREYFVSALTMRRHHPLVVGIPASVMTEAEKDALFIQAGALNA